MSEKTEKRKSILLKSGVLLGVPDRKLSGKVMDIAIDSSGMIAKIGTDLDSKDWDTSLNLKGSYVSPGWIDLHTHIYEASSLGIEPDSIGPETGVTTLVDAGTSGEATFAGLRKYVIEKKNYTIRAILNINSLGIGGMCNHENIDLLRSTARVEENKEHIRGIKVLASKKFVGNSWVLSVTAAKRLAVDMNLPLMVHLGQPPVYLEELVYGILDSGDIVTHCFHGKVGNSVRSSASRIIALYRNAVEKGILLDVGHGVSSFSIESARGAIEQGIKPHTISSDLHAQNINGPVWSLAVVMSKMLACNLTLEEVVEMVTLNPATILGETDYGSLEAGARANFTVFDLEKGEFLFTDSGAVDDITRGSDPKYQTQFPGAAFIKPRFVYYNGTFSKATARGLEENRSR